jgi:flagellar protein FlaI
MRKISSRSLFKTLVRGYEISMRRKIKREVKPEVIEIVPKKIEIPPKIEEVEVKPKKVEVEGVEIPSVLPPTVKVAKPPEEEREKILLVYPLIPKKPAPKDLVFAYAKIFWNKKENRYIYQVVEPELTERLVDMLKKIKSLLEQKLDVDFSKLTKTEAKEYLRKKMEEVIGYYGFKLHPIEREVLHYYAERDFIGLGKIEPLMNDDQIEDISCDGLGVPIFVFHRNPMIGSVATNLVYKDADELDSFIIRLSQLCGKSVSVATPLLSGSLPDGSRVHATLATDIARKGSNFTIRKFTESPLTPVHLLLYNTLDVKTLAFLWLCVDYGASMFISGGTATGKTSLLNVLSLFIRPEEKIVSIEDTAELRLPHPHWVPQVARVPIATEKGEVDLFALLKESLRQRPDYIVVGEVRGPEAFVLFQQIASIPAYENVIILNSKCLKQVPISKLKMNGKIQTFAINPLTERVEIFPIEAKVSHGLVDRIYKITTKTGREVFVTPYHSLFIYKNGLIPVFVKSLKKGEKIAIPAKIPCGFNNKAYLNLLELFPDIRVYSPKLIKKAAKKLGFEKASKICKVVTISNYYGVNNCALPLSKFKKLMKKAKIRYSLDEIKVRFERNSSLSSAKLSITPYFLRLMGYYISEGTINKANNSVALYNKNPKILADMKKCIIKVTGKIPTERKCKGWGESYELRFNNKTLFEFFKRFCGATSKKKRIPEFIFGLSKPKIGEFLSALYAGDGSLKEREYSYYTSSKKLVNDLLLLLLTLGIVGRVEKRKREKKTEYEICFYRKDYQQRFLKYVRCIGVIPEIRKVGRKRNTKEIFLDEIESIQEVKLNKPVEVYDLTVRGAQNFIGGVGGILLHNTGHPSLATIHAEDMTKLIDRLITPPISLPPALIENLNLVIFLLQTRYKGKQVRRVNEVLEIVGFDREKNLPITNLIFKWNPATDTFDVVNKSVLLKKFAAARGISEKEILEELQRRMLVLNWMLDQNILDYRDVFKIITAYYTQPERIISLAKG